MATKLPKHIIQMVEKNNMVIAIKTLAEEQNISMSDAKIAIDEYEAQLKKQQQDKIEAIAFKQGVSTATQPLAKSSHSNHNLLSETKASSNTDSKSHNDSDLKGLNDGLDSHLKQIGYKNPLLPYWVKRVIIIVLIVLVLVLVLKQLLPN